MPHPSKNVFPYALTNPISVILDKPPEGLTREDLLRLIEEEQIERITFHYTALDGQLKELRLPVLSRARAERLLTDGERVDGSSLFKGLIDVGVSDLYVVPVYRTAFLNPFDSGSLDFVCRFMTCEGDFAPFAPDNILRRAAALLEQQTGFELYALGELEFFLLSEPDVCAYPTPAQRGYHNAAPFARTGHILNEIVHHVAQITGAVKYAHFEVGSIESLDSDLPEIAGKQGEQAEIEFLPTPVDEAADNLVLARWIIRTTAWRRGCIATFTPKLEEGFAGSGMHVHMELRREGKNVMTDAHGALTEAARRLIGGLCAYAPTLTAFGNPVSSAYLRLVPNQEAPTRVCWSDLNRSALIRVPLAWSRAENLASKVNPGQASPLPAPDGRQTVELRSPDGSALIHLLMAGITMAAEWGLTSPESPQIAESLYVRGNIADLPGALDKGTELPRSCVESGRMLLDFRELYERESIFPAAIIDFMAGLLRAEDDEDMNRRLMALPPGARLAETRRIMHKDLHRH